MAVNINLGLTADAAGTVDIITATYSPAVTSLTDRLVLIFRAMGANTSTTPTFSPNGLTARTIVKKGGQVLAAGDIAGNRFQALVIYDLANTRWELLNPATDLADTFWQVGAGTNSLMDKRSTTGSGNNGFTAGDDAVNTGIQGQAIGFAAVNTSADGQALGSGSANGGDNGQAVGNGSVNNGERGTAIGPNSDNEGVSGQAIGDTAVNTFDRSTALGYESQTTAADQTNISKTIRFQEYTGAGIKLLQHDDDGIVSGVTVLPVTVTGTKSQVGLGNVDNTSDANKPVSTAQQTALDLKANLASPAFTGNPTAPTQAAGDNSTKVATTAYADRKTDKLLTANRQAASYTLVLTDADKLVEMNVAGANDLTVPTNASVAFSIGTQILLAQYGAGQTTVVASGGVTIRSSGGKLKLAAQYAGATLVKIATNEWYLFGDITT